MRNSTVLSGAAYPEGTILSARFLRRGGGGARASISERSNFGRSFGFDSCHEAPPEEVVGTAMLTLGDYPHRRCRLREPRLKDRHARRAVFCGRYRESELNRYVIKSEPGCLSFVFTRPLWDIKNKTKQTKKKAVLCFVPFNEKQTNL